MTWLRKVRPLLLIVFGLVGVGCLLGARLLAHGSGGGTDSTPKTAAPTTNGKDGSGPIVLGYADSNPSPVRYGLPPVLQAGEVVKVFVKADDVVKAGAELYKFDTTIQEADLLTAQRAVSVAKTKVAEAKELGRQHENKINLQKQTVSAAYEKMQRAYKGREVWEFGFRQNLGKETEERIKELIANDPRGFELDTARIFAYREHDIAKATLEALQSVNTGVAVAAAEADVKRAESLVEKAKAAIDLCTVKARQDGTIEQVYVSPGTQMGISTRTPALILVPAGPLVVRAEVEAEFAHRIGPDKIGKDVTIYDNSDPKLAYKGVVKRIPTVFLPKQNAGDGLIPNDTRVLEVLVEVTDSAPAKVPPLRVGQKVRVNFGQ